MFPSVIFTRIYFYSVSCKLSWWCEILYKVRGVQYKVSGVQGYLKDTDVYCS